MNSLQLGGLLVLLCCIYVHSQEIPITCEEEVNSKQLKCDGVLYTEGDHLDVPWSAQFWVDAGISGCLVLVAGLMSGLTMGLMSMDTLNLKIMINGQDERQKRCAAKILPLVERHHLLLVTLLLMNAVAAEALPIFLDRLVHPVVAIAVSVSLVLLFGEIIPQAVCTRFGLQIGAALSWFVWILIGALFPLSWPISKLLDWLLGHDNGTFFRRAELKELVHLHAEDVHVPMGENLTSDEVRIIKGALDMKEKSVGQCLTPADKIFAVNIDDKLDKEMLVKIVETGHHRIPVYHNTRDHFIGMILIQDLVLLDPNGSTSVRQLKLYRVPIVDADMPLFDMLHQFQTGRSHMAVVLDPLDHISPMGIITLEDVMEELLQQEIMDEEDFRIEAGENKYDPLKDIKILSRLRRGSIAPTGRRPSVFYTGSNGSPHAPTPGGGSSSQLQQYQYPHNPQTSMDFRNAQMRKPSVAFANAPAHPPSEAAYRTGRRATEANVAGILKNPMSLSTGNEQTPLITKPNGTINSSYASPAPSNN